jgi:hypothetical protein
MAFDYRNISYNFTENVNYFLRAPNQQQDGFTYAPYPYPHPLTLEGIRYPVNVTGVVRDSSNGLAVQNAIVSCNNTFNSTTNSTGGYFLSLPIAAPFSCNLTVSKEGYLSNSTIISFSSNGSYTRNFYITQLKLSKISGRLIDKNNNPLNANITVYLQGSVIASNKTDSNGYYYLAVSSGIYDIQFNFSSFNSFKLISVNATGNVSNLIGRVSFEASIISIEVENNYTKRIEVYSDKRPYAIKINKTSVASWSYDGTSKLLTINISVIMAKSGSVEDIQEAVNAVVAMGGGIVYIPEGNFTFNASGSYRVNINVPVNGINIFGAGINRTVLQMPINDSAPDTIMFYANCLSGGKLRISGITFKGRPNRDSSPTGDVGIRIESCTDFRVDHCSFYDMGGNGINVGDQEMTYGHYGGDLKYVSQGVIDHCDFIDIYKPNTTAQGRGYGYGVGVGRAYHYLWTVPNLYPDDPWTMFGKYYKNTYIEDCYFVGARHAVTGNWAGAYVLRNSIIEDLRVYEAVTTGHPVRTNVLGMLTCEIYNVTVRNTRKYVSKFCGFHVEGGSALIYNNRIENLVDNAFSIGSCEDANNTFFPLGNTKEVYIWNNTVINSTLLSIVDNSGLGGCPAPIEGKHYFFHAPPAERNYTPYPYPHPLTKE